MPETVRYPDRDAPGVVIEGYVVRRVDSDDVEPVMRPTYDVWRPRQR